VKIVCIGAGLGGLAAAIRLQAQGHDVVIIEQLDAPGGRAYAFQQDGFSFDAGPTIITAPWLVEELFTLAGKQLPDYVKLVRLDPAYKLRFADGSVFRYACDGDALAAEVRRFAPGDLQGYYRFRAIAEATYARAMPLIDRPFLHIADMLRVLPDLLRVGAHRSIASVAHGCFRDDRLQQVFSFHPLFIGGNPFTAPAIYALIHALELRGGVWFAMGGMRALVDALARLFVELGGELRLQRQVARIALSGTQRQATGVVLTSGESIAADAVLSNADLAATYTNLLPPAARTARSDRRVRRGRYAMSLCILYFGTDRRYDDVGPHEIIMGPRYRGLLDDVFRGQRLAEDFSLYLYRPSAVDPSLAPRGCDTWYALAPVPNLAAPIDWDREGPALRTRIVQYLEERFLPGLSRQIVTQRWVDPRYFRDTLGSHLGAAFALQPTLLQSAWFRPHNVSADIENLYFVGAGTHPGPGVPGVISSGKIAADLIGPAKRLAGGRADQPNGDKRQRGWTQARFPARWRFPPSSV
jgi:phytoene desaturase